MTFVPAAAYNPYCRCDSALFPDKNMTMASGKAHTRISNMVVSTQNLMNRPNMAATEAWKTRAAGVGLKALMFTPILPHCTGTKCWNRYRCNGG